MSKVYDFIFGLNFGYFDDWNVMYKGISLDTDEEDVHLFEYKYNSLYGVNPYISHIDISSGIAKPSNILSNHKLDKSNSIPIINLSFNPLNSKKFTTKYLNSVKTELKTHFNKFVKILISGHGQSINSLGTGNDKLNSGYVTIKEIVDILAFLTNGCYENISYLKICLVACGANKVGTPKFLYEEMIKLSFPFPFSVVGYDNKINMCNALNTRHDENVQKFSTFYSNEYEGRITYRQSFKKELNKIINAYTSKLPFLLYMYNEAINSQGGRITVKTIDVLCSKLMDTIEYAELNDSRKRYYISINITPKTQYHLNLENIAPSKELYQTLIKFKNNFSEKADLHYQEIKKAQFLQTEFKKDRYNYYTDV
ncbi:hypothetical protein IB642_04060 [Allofrancisella guangzhouensis]|uniref:Uncharacterized protein n=1 Tax=Allofrancisella guangzhouensis TaxID=594679 RepID=A0A0A8E404_9GAMM|nr:hypothetical protein [Allofrancisella guangzhouensis]AJC48950.1 hypothetical protein SD28_04540 [Allofrancisella guangzhouensis]MBK2027084.1 hypothetical protein [Allofrancisella guangzhouensis]MBK2044193.1 hypothetical protein [Allofrancisella guangzhouensis]MBK2045678.1 hypothetical protein [Allofrancisella guangzhouensis]